MNSDNKKLDIFIFIKTIWEEKLLVTLFTIIPIFISYIYYVKSENLYEHKISFNIDVEKFVTYRTSNDCDIICKKRHYFLELNNLLNENLELNEQFQITYKKNEISKLNEIYLNLKNKANIELSNKYEIEMRDFNKYMYDFNFFPSKIYFSYILERVRYNEIMIKFMNNDRRVFILQEPILTKLPNRKFSLFLFTLLLSPLLSSFLIFIKYNHKTLLK